MFTWPIVILRDFFFRLLFLSTVYPFLKSPLLPYQPPLQPGGRRDPPGDMPALHPAAVLLGDVHHGDVEVHVPAGGVAASQKKYNHDTARGNISRYTPEFKPTKEEKCTSLYCRPISATKLTTMI